MDVQFKSSKVYSAIGLLKHISRSLCLSDLTMIDYCSGGEEVEKVDLVGPIVLQSFNFEKMLNSKRRSTETKVEMAKLKLLFPTGSSFSLITVGDKICLRAKIITNDEDNIALVPEDYKVINIIREARLNYVLDILALADHLRNSMNFSEVSSTAIFKKNRQFSIISGSRIKVNVEQGNHFEVVNVMPSKLENDLKAVCKCDWLEWVLMEDKTVQSVLSGPDPGKSLTFLGKDFFRKTTFRNMWSAFSGRLKQTLVVVDRMTNKALFVYGLNKHSGAMTGHTVRRYLNIRNECLTLLSLGDNMPIKEIEIIRTQVGNHVSPLVRIAYKTFLKKGMTRLCKKEIPFDFHCPELTEHGRLKVRRFQPSAKTVEVMLTDVRVKIPKDLNEERYLDEIQFPFNLEQTEIFTRYQKNQLLVEQSGLQGFLELSAVPDVRDLSGEIVEQGRNLQLEECIKEL